MKKIPTIYLRNENDRAHITDQINPECLWVFDGEGLATRMFDGTCVKKDESGMWWARREVKKGKNPPEGFVLEDYDDVTGKKLGWVLIDESPFHKFWQEALVYSYGDNYSPGTYELIGPKINDNPEKVTIHVMCRHGYVTFSRGHSPLDLIEECRRLGWEGVVWHHPDGRMAKLKVRDFA